MSDSGLDRDAITAAIAARAGLGLSPAEHRRLSEYVVDVWDMADRLRLVPSPGQEGAGDRMPLRAAYANRAADGEGVAKGVDAEPRTRPDEGRSLQDADLPFTEDPLLAGLVEHAEAMAAGRYRPIDLVRSQLDRIARFDGVLRSAIAVDEEGALRAAASLSDELADRGARSLLHGVPVGAKDSIPAVGMPCTYNSPLMRDWWPRRDAEAVRRLRAAGAVMVAKHNLNEFGWSIPSEDDLAPPPRNPWLPEEYAVGSSSGGGVAVAAGLAVAALGTDGGGSARLPAGQNLLFGLKPGHGRAPSAGVSEGSVSEVSVLARRAEDAAAVMAVLLIDQDLPDAAARLRREPDDWVRRVRQAPTRLRVAVPEGYVADVGMEDDVRALWEATCKAVQEQGHELLVLPRPTLAILHDAVRANFVFIAAEHYFDHEGPGKDRGRYGPSAGFYNLPGACLSAADYLHAMRVRELVRAEVDAVLGQADLLLTPTSPVTRTSTARNPKTHRRGGNAAYTAPFNLTGHAGVSFPVGLSAEGMPVGMQLIGPRDGELALLQAARAFSAGFDLPAYPDLARVARDVAALAEG